MKTGIYYLRNKIVFVAIAILALALSGCPPGREDPPPDGRPSVPTLVSISVTPKSPFILVKTTKPFVATGIFSNSKTEDMTSKVTWSSSVSTVATTTPTGVVTANAEGTTQVRATFGTLIGATTLTVTGPPTLRSIAVTPASRTMGTGTTTPFTATGTFSDNFEQTTQNLTASASWSSSRVDVATISSGVAESKAVGTTTLTATVGSISGSSSLLVSDVDFITVLPLNPTIIAKTTQLFSATAKLLNGTLEPITSLATWSSSNVGLATIGVASGLATAGNPSSTSTVTITVTFQGKKGTASLTIIPATLLSISITPSNPSVIGGLTQQFTAMGQYDNGQSQNITADVIWDSSSITTATITPSGNATALSVLSPSTTTIKATLGTISGQTVLAVLPGTLCSLTMAPINASIANETKRQFTATGTFNTGTTCIGGTSITFDVTPLVTWTSSSTIATIDPSGIVTAVSTGTTNIGALFGSSTATSTSLTVTGASLTKVSVTPVSVAMPAGVTRQFIATGAFSDNTTQDLGLSVIWGSAAPAIATIDIASGLARGVAFGSTTITATSTFGNPKQSGTTTLTVIEATLLSLSIAPLTPVIPVGSTKQFKVTGFYSIGSTEDLTSAVTWSSSLSSLVSVNSTGLATGLAGGTATITAFSPPATSTTTDIEVVSATLDSISVLPASSSSIPAGITRQYTAFGIYNNGSIQNLTNAVLWGSTNPAFATINNAGLATAINAGSATISATLNTPSGNVSCVPCPLLTVNSATLTGGISVTPSLATIGVGTTLQYAATATYSDASSFNVTAFSDWRSGSGLIATVNAGGLVTGTGVGNTTISANFGGTSGSESLVVKQLTLVGINVKPSNPSIHLGQTQPFTAEAVFADGTKQDFTDSVFWQRQPGFDCATISNASGSKGLATSIKSGDCIMIAVHGFTIGTTTLTVKDPIPTDILLGKNHTCVRLTNGSMQCWGENFSGQLGTGQTTNVSVPSPVDVIIGTSATLMAAGGAHTCASFNNGTVNCWGKNADGQLGNGTQVNSSRPVRVTGVLGATALATGGSHTCSVFESGAVKCWGLNSSGQLGNGSTATSTTPVSVINVLFPHKITAGGSHTCALLALNGGVKCWGNGSSGQLGNNATNNSNVPVFVDSLTTATDVSAGGSHTCALLLSGGVQCWGNNDKGQLGNGNNATSTTPVFVINLETTVTAISAGGSHTCALLTSGKVQCWGDNRSGQLGNDGTVSSVTPVTVVVDNGSAGTTTLLGVSGIAAGGAHTCAFLSIGGLKCWGENKFGQIGNAVQPISKNPIVVPDLTTTSPNSLDTGAAYTCGVSAGTVLCLGNNDFGQLGDGSTISRNTSLAVTGITNATAVSVGRFHACALLGTGLVKCWGEGSFGQLGNTLSQSSSLPVDVDMSGLTGLTATSISAGGAHTCMRLSNGTARCWGGGGSGQLGNNNTANQPTPVSVSNLSSVSSISVGDKHTCALSGTQILCWGANASGQLGDGSAEDTSATPVPVLVGTATTATSVSSGGSHTCGIFTGVDGGVKCWGFNNKGQLGIPADDPANPNPTRHPLPNDVSIGGTSVSITAGSTHTCVLLLDASVLCWGDNSSGQLGNGSTADSSSPVVVTEKVPGNSTLTDLTNVIAVSAGSEVADTGKGAGESHTCAIILSGSVKCWGQGFSGQIGSNLILIETKPVTVQGLF